jgi:glucose uptake protein
MFIIQNYPLAVFFCVITMLCWGSWANTQKLATAGWRFELFYWDYSIGILIIALFAFTLGSMGDGGRGFLEDLSQASWSNIYSALIEGSFLTLPIFYSLPLFQSRHVVAFGWDWHCACVGSL